MHVTGHLDLKWEIKSLVKMFELVRYLLEKTYSFSLESPILTHKTENLHRHSHIQYIYRGTNGRLNDFLLDLARQDYTFHRLLEKYSMCWVKFYIRFFCLI